MLELKGVVVRSGDHGNGIDLHVAEPIQHLLDPGEPGTQTASPGQALAG